MCHLFLCTLLTASLGAQETPRVATEARLWLREPAGQAPLRVTVHCYEPFYSTHQGAPWVKLHDLRGIVYPGPPASPLAVPERHRENAGIREFIARYNTLPTDQNPCSAAAVRELLDHATAWAEHFGRPIHLGEFGSMAEARGIPWTLWDWKATFGYWDSQKTSHVFPARRCSIDSRAL